MDLYGVQIVGRLEDMRFFRNYVGGSPTNMAVGIARSPFGEVSNELARRRGRKLYGIGGKLAKQDSALAGKGAGLRRRGARS